MAQYDVFWSPEGRRIATVEADSEKSAIRKAPLPYRKYKGECYAQLAITEVHPDALRQVKENGRKAGIARRNDDEDTARKIIDYQSKYVSLQPEGTRKLLVEAFNIAYSLEF